MNKKLVKKRLLIYLLPAFLLVWVPTAVYAINGGEYESAAMQAILAFSMLCPGIAMLMTRWITKEGFPMKGRNSLGLGIVLSNKKWVFYLMGILLPYIYWELGIFTIYLLAPECFDKAMLAEYNIPETVVWLYPIMVMSVTCMFSIGALGEEAGWRGYMMPKLEELFGIRKAVIIGGIIWGVWHFPAIMMGHNFGTGYWGEPWFGFIAFTLQTICMNGILTYLTKKTDSVWPAAFLHAVNNGMPSILGLYFDDEKLTGILANPVVCATISNWPIFLFGMAAAVLLCRKQKQKAT